jgi:hypothetical protein
MIVEKKRRTNMIMATRGEERGKQVSHNCNNNAYHKQTSERIGRRSQEEEEAKRDNGALLCLSHYLLILKVYK